MTLWSGPAAAQRDFQGWYLGAGIGQVSAEYDVSDFDDGTISDAHIDDEDSGWKLFGGYRLNRYFAVESGFTDLNNDVDSKTTFEGTSAGDGTLFSSGKVSVDIDEPTGLFITAIGVYSLNDPIELFAKIGLVSWEADVTTSDASGSTTIDRSGTDGIAGFGVTIRLTDHLWIRGEMERLADVAGENLDFASLNIVYDLHWAE